MSEKSAPYRHAFWSIADNFSQQALSFGIFILLARWLTPTAFGLLAIAHLLVQFIRIAVLDALVLPTLRQPQFLRADFHWLFSICSIAAVIAAVLMAALAFPLARYFDASELVPVFLGMSIAVVFHGLSRAYDAVLLRQANFRLLAIRSMIAVSAGGIVAIYMASKGYGAMALVGQQLTTSGLTFCISLVCEWQSWRPGWGFSLQRFRHHRREVAKVGASSLLLYANSNADAALVSAAFGPTAAGLYNLAKRVTSAVSTMIAAALSRVASSMFFRNADNRPVLLQHYTKIATVSLFGLTWIYGVIANFSYQIVPLVFGPMWRDSTPVLIALCIAGLFQGCFNIGQNLSLATGHQHRTLRLGVAQLLMAIVLSGLLMIPLSGLGIAIGFGIAAMVMSAVMHCQVSRQLKISTMDAIAVFLPSTIGLIGLTAAGQFILRMNGSAMSWDILLSAIAAVSGVFVLGFAIAHIGMRKLHRQ